MNQIICSSCTIIVKSTTKSSGELRSLHYCDNTQLNKAVQLRQTEKQLRRSKNQPIRENFLKNKILGIKAQLKKEILV